MASMQQGALDNIFRHVTVDYVHGGQRVQLTYTHIKRKAKLALCLGTTL
jgi:hypothetical protein